MNLSHLTPPNCSEAFMQTGGLEEDSKRPSTSMGSTEEDLRRLATGIGLKPMPFRDESLAPRVDETLLRELVRRNLSEDAARSVYRLIYSFRSWTEAHTLILLEEFRKGAPLDEASGDDKSAPRE